MIGITPKAALEAFARVGNSYTIPTVRMEHCCGCGKDINPDTLRKYFGHILCASCVSKLTREGDNNGCY